MVGIYKITSPSGKVYIGQSINISNRFSRYINMGKELQKQRKLYASLLKYGSNSHKYEVLHELPKDVTREVLNTYEVIYINQFSDCGVKLMNIKEGGNNGRHSEESKMRISKNWRGGNRTISEATREKMRIAGSKPKPHMIGRKMSDGAKIKMSESAKKRIGRKYSEKGLISIKNNGSRLGKSNMGKPSHRKGVKHSIETIEKIKQAINGGSRNKTTFKYELTC